MKELEIKDFTYELPEELIARHPLEDRDKSRLMVYRSGIITDSVFNNLPSFLPDNTLLVFNNTKVVRARLLFHNKNGARIELFCLEPPAGLAVETAMQQKQQVVWKCLVGNLKKWKEEELLIQTDSVEVKARIIAKENDHQLLQFTWNNEFSFFELLEALGKIPLPPYLKREAEIGDSGTYQTVYASLSGSVAAPTAGLHFTNSLLKEVEEKGTHLAYTTLHVGAGTFMPVKTERISEHSMHAEEIIITSEFLRKVSEHNGNVVAVGTTSLRTMESIYWLSHLIVDKELSSENGFFYLSQWAAYGLQKDHSIPFQLSCSRLLHYLEKHQLEFIRAKTQIIISPGYRINSVKALITNFHQPNSTLLILIATLVGEKWKELYEHAKQQGYRFLSYGDGSLLFKH